MQLFVCLTYFFNTLCRDVCSILYLVIRTESQILRLDDRHQPLMKGRKVSCLFRQTQKVPARKFELRKCLILSGNGKRNFGIRVSHILFIRTMQDLLTATRLKFFLNFFLFRLKTKSRPGVDIMKLEFFILWSSSGSNVKRKVSK